MSGKMREVISEIGLQPTKSYRISTIVRYFNKSKGIKDEDPKRESGRSNNERKVPGFGVDKTQSQAVNLRADEKTIEQAEGLMKRYDRNQNGYFDASEIKKIPWGSPDPRQSDLNRDGRISRNELVQRLELKNSRRNKTASSKRSSSTSDSKRRKEDAQRRESERQKYRSSVRAAGSSSSTSRSSTTSRSASSSRRPTADRSKYEKYAASIVKNYDKDNDGKLSKEEFGKMRRPPSGADQNKDGFVTKSELLDSLMNKSSSTSSGSKTVSKTSATRSTRNSRYGSKRSSSRSFQDMDANKDNQIQMHEYSSDWTDARVEAFYKIDRNGDGIITSVEWSEQSN